MTGGHGSHPLDRTELALAVVADARVILELAAGAVALAIAVWVVTAAPLRILVGRLMSHDDRRRRRGRNAIATQRSTFDAPPSGREVDRSANEE